MVTEMKIVIYEDDSTDRFYPIAISRPLWDLRFGCFSIHERISHLAKLKNIPAGNLAFFCRDSLSGVFKEKFPDLIINDDSFLGGKTRWLFINARALAGKELFETEETGKFITGDFVHGWSYDGELPDTLKWSNDHFDNIPDLNEIDQPEWPYLNQILDAVRINPEQIVYDYRNFFSECDSNNKDVTIIGERNLLYIADNVQVDPFVVFDMTKGPIVIREGVIINSMTRIEGPAFIGRNSVILGAKLREGCSIGHNCRVGGEVEEAIFQANSNKYHDGFIGHAYIGEWVNLGAMTTNSDLKNNYTTVKVYTPSGYIDSGELKVGAFIGDFTKTSIGTLMNTGTVLGFGAMMVHSGRMTPPYVPDLSWYIKNELRDPNKLNEFINTCRTMMARRGLVFTENYELLIRKIYLDSADERLKTIKEWKV